MKEQAYKKITASMHLRAPQQEALNKFHTILSNSYRDLEEMDHNEIKNLFKSKFPNWNYDENNSLSFTFHLATGVGKTRLIGAIMAYLYLSNQSKHFIIVSPRTEIIRKFKEVCSPGSKDYIFVDKNLVDTPSLQDGSDNGNVIHFYTGPEIWILSPQAFTAGSARIKKRTEHQENSVVDYLKSQKDLVVFFDESHHLGTDINDDSVWRNELNQLQPKMLIGTTASVDDFKSTNVIYSYDLVRCLNEHLYTKFVQIIPQKKDSLLSDDDFDKLTLRFGLSRLDYKQAALDDYCLKNGLSRVKATMLVACADIRHAEQVTSLLKTQLGDDAVLLVHSRMSSKDYEPKLKSIELPDTPARVIVNVSMLNEGWDVSNLYVITPLRAMASTTLVTQIMGRGLRLPFGKQVGNDDVDTLDVLCFGRESMEEICDNLLNKGFGVNTGGVTVTTEPDPVDPDPYVPTKLYGLKITDKAQEIRFPQFLLDLPVLNLDDVSIPTLAENKMQSFKISDPRTIRNLNGKNTIEREKFIQMVTSDVLNKCKYLTFRRHYLPLNQLVTRFLLECGFTNSEIPLEPEKVISHFKKNLDDLSKLTKPSYKESGDKINVKLSGHSIYVPETFNESLSVINFTKQDWKNKKAKGLPFSGWIRSAFEAVPFDTFNELKVAKIIDRSEQVNWWFRNLSGMISLPTPAGNYSPDFAIFLNINGENILLEVKGDSFIQSPESDASVKANAAKEWCKMQTNASGTKWQYWLTLDSDIDSCESFNDLYNVSDRTEY